MLVTFIRKDPRSNLTNCPTVYVTDEGTLIIQGYVVTEEARAQMKRIPRGEDAVEIPVRMIPIIMEAFFKIHEQAAGPDTIKRPTEENSDPDVLDIWLARGPAGTGAAA